MITIASSAPSARRAYDHRLRELVCSSGDRTLARRLSIPRSTVTSWRRRGVRTVVTVEACADDNEHLLNKISKLDRRARVLAAVVRLLLALLRTSGGSLRGKRVPEGQGKATILRAIAGAEPVLPLFLILRILGLEPARYHAWLRKPACELTDLSSCPRTKPARLTSTEISTIKDMVLAPGYRHMPLGTLARYAQRVGKVFAAASTWANLVRERGWRRPRLRIHPPRPILGVRASKPNETWHVDVTVIRLLNGTRAYLQAVIDNYSRKILAWTVGDRLDPGATCHVLLAAGRHLVTTGRPQVYADSGVENVNAAVDGTLLGACLDRVLAQVEVAYSNSMIEAFWRSLKHGWLYLNTVDSIERLRSLVAFYVEQHNTQMPHRAFGGQTPDEIYFGTAVALPAELAAARSKARAARLVSNRALVCEVCVGEQNASATSEIPP